MMSSSFKVKGNLCTCGQNPRGLLPTGHTDLQQEAYRKIKHVKYARRTIV